MTIPPAAVIALHVVQMEIENALEWVKNESFIVDYAVIKRSAGGLASVVESSTAMHALLFVRQKLTDLDALVARVELQEQRVRELEWVLDRAEEIVREEHGKHAAYAFEQAWGELPKELQSARVEP